MLQEGFFSRAHSRRLVPFLAGLFLLPGLLLLAGVKSARAQEADAGGKPPKEVLQLFDDLDDLDKLHYLNPLKLTTAQIDKLLAAIAAAKETYDKKVADITLPPIRKMGDEIRETKKRALAGADIPKTFDDRIKALQQNYFNQREKINVDNWTGLVTATKKILTEEQVALAIKLAKTGQKGASGQDDKWYNVYVLQVFISYPRITPLLNEMKAAKAAASDNKSARRENRRRADKQRVALRSP